ncbi:MAG: 6-bladed beta-propeller [Candidatus Aminicenantes bacterium]|nr:6-bladed beta-propeller [Candidatus Aminicenantes bacterium]
MIKFKGYIYAFFILSLCNSFTYEEKTYKFADVFKKDKEVHILTHGLNVWRLGELKVDLDKNIIFLDPKGCQILVFDQKGNFLCTIGRKGEGPGEFKFPISIEVDNKNNIFVSDLPLKRISKFSLDKGFINSFIISSTQNQAWGIKINSNGFIFLKGFIRKDYNHPEFGMWINKYNLEGRYITSFFPSNKYNKNWVQRIAPFCSFDIDGEDIIYAVQHCDYRISKYNSEGKLLTEFGKAPSYFRHPNIRKKIDFTRFSAQSEIINELKILSASWTKLIDIIVLKDEFLLLILEMNNLIKGFDKKYVIDIWDKKGNFIAGGIQTDYRLLCRDSDDFLYFLILKEEENLEKEPKYRIGKYTLLLN